MDEMAQIHELTEILADQIAAGEVIERPASVVKELVENAIDAKSTRIDILLSEAGLKEIQVIDNGQGIAQAEVTLAFKRHATSKIYSRQDLFRVQTLGFRGEALPSIASVADVTMQTAQKDQPGVLLHIKGGKILEQKPAQSRTGTTISVADLFYNTPARLKYLGSLQTELAAISDIVNRLALSHPKIAFSLSNNGRQLLQTVGNGQLLQNFSAIYGMSNAKQMVQFNGQDNDFKLDGYVSLPKLTRASRNYITLLLNGRYIKNYRLTKAILNGYGSKLMVGRYPLAVVNIELDPLLVDVNVHPTKQEVRISKEQELCELLTTSIASRLAKENLIPNGLNNLQKKAIKTTGQQTKLALDENLASYLAKENVAFKTTNEQVTAALMGASLNDIKPKANPKQSIIIEDKKQLFSKQMQAWDAKYVKQKAIQAEASQVKKTSDMSAKRFPTLDYIGQLHATYLLAQGEDGLYLIDQHAAQERIKFEEYREKIGKMGVAKQKLLLPIVLSYPTSEALKVAQNKEKLAQLGVNLEDFGQNTFIIREHPQWFKKGQEEAIINELIDYCLQDPQLTVEKFRQKTAIMMSCKRSIKANHHLDELQAKSLLKQLAQCQNPFNCPHGRPVVVQLSNKDLEHMFKRIQDSHRSFDSLEE